MVLRLRGYARHSGAHAAYGLPWRPLTQIRSKPRQSPPEPCPAGVGVTSETRSEQIRDYQLHRCLNFRVKLEMKFMFESAVTVPAAARGTHSGCQWHFESDSESA